MPNSVCGVCVCVCVTPALYLSVRKNDNKRNVIDQVIIMPLNLNLAHALEKGFIGQHSLAVWAEKIYASGIPVSTQGYIYMFIPFGVF